MNWVEFNLKDMSKLVPFSALILAMVYHKTLPYILYNFVISKEIRKIQETKIPYQDHHMIFMQLRLMLFALLCTASYLSIMFWFVFTSVNVRHLFSLFR